MLPPTRTRFPYFPVCLLLAYFLWSAAPATAQVIAQAAVNGASFMHSLLPNGKLAPGELFTVFGSGMGPTSLTQTVSFPLSTQLAGTSVRVAIAGTELDCWMVFTSDRQVGAILPSNTPVGTGWLTVSYGSQGGSLLGNNLLDTPMFL